MAPGDQTASNEDGTLVGVGASVAACQRSKDDRGGRAVSPTRCGVAGAAIPFLWTCWIFIEDDLDKICAVKMSFPRKY